MSDEACEKRTEPQDTEVAKNREEDFSRKKAKERAQRNARRGGSQKPEAGGRIFGRRVIYHGRPEVSLKKSSRKGAKTQSFQRIIDAIEEIGFFSPFAIPLPWRLGGLARDLLRKFSPSSFASSPSLRFASSPALPKIILIFFCELFAPPCG